MPIRTRDDEQPILAGQRFVVDIDLFDNRTSEPMSGLAVGCQFIRPHNVPTQIMSMVEVGLQPGRYTLSYVPEVGGEWIVRIVVPDPNESVFRYKFYIEHDEDD